MKRMGGFLSISIWLFLTAIGCIGTDPNESETMGKLALPLVSNGPSGTQYRLREAIFDINPTYWNYGYAGAGGVGGTGSPLSMVVDSEEDPDADSIQVSLENGNYQVYLRDGWYLEKIENGEAEPVEATLLSSNNQWIYVNPRQTSTVSFQFGIGERSVWLNGNLNIELDIYEDPDEYYGPYPGGAGGGYAGAGGSITTGGTGYLAGKGGSVGASGFGE